MGIERLNVCQYSALEGERDVPAHERRNPKARFEVAYVLQSRIRNGDAIQNPAAELQVFGDIFAGESSLIPNAGRMRSVVIQRFAEIRDIARESHRCPELPVATQLKALVGSANFFIHVFPEND